VLRQNHVGQQPVLMVAPATRGRPLTGACVSEALCLTVLLRHALVDHRAEAPGRYPRAAPGDREDLAVDIVPLLSECHIAGGNNRAARRKIGVARSRLPAPIGCLRINLKLKRTGWRHKSNQRQNGAADGHRRARQRLLPFVGAQFEILLNGEKCGTEYCVARLSRPTQFAVRPKREDILDLNCYFPVIGVQVSKESAARH
jgi:hypothetical protein